MNVRPAPAKPVLAVTLGDASGIGPELVAKIIADGFLEDVARPLIVGDGRVLRRGMSIAGVDFPVHRLTDPAEADFSGGIQLIDTGDLDPDAVQLARVSPIAGKSAGDRIIQAIDLYRQGKVAGIVFAPLNKAALKAAGFNYESEHELFAELFGITAPHGEINVLEGLMTSRVTSHIPLSEVSRNLSREGILAAIQLLDSAQKKAKVAKPRLAVAALNPHSGESGTCGREEIELIAPAVAEARRSGMDAIGPISADTLFLRAFRGEFDAVVTMYHDQGQIALKTRGFERGVTLAGGMPAPLATPAHGTAFDIAGKNLARTGAIKEAVRLVARMAG
ncbi:MAG: 4-hydroxythreonine-4-phosphate dehydrogenase PdxA [Planctomycetota bacterium]|jgi:4-hydroxythreonine-4-phosphate dehydrogenase|nr:4-hydroxythreonine-4-phosphate dehydrogenase PdxA [Planctomycetota bacterium]